MSNEENPASAIEAIDLNNINDPLIDAIEHAHNRINRSFWMGLYYFNFFINILAFVLITVLVSRQNLIIPPTVTLSEIVEAIANITVNSIPCIPAPPAGLSPILGIPSPPGLPPPPKPPITPHPHHPGGN